ncbi:MAG: hypothetical protein ACR2HV_06355, partial [Acidimicrobiales bacterium]
MQMRRERVTVLLAVILLVASAGLASASTTPAADQPLSKKAGALAKVPGAVLHAVQGDGQPAGSLADRSVRTDPAGRIELDFHAAGPTGASEEADLVALGGDGIRSLNLSPDLNISMGMIEAWLPTDAVLAAAALPWVTSVTTPAYGHTSAVTGSGEALHEAALAQAKGITGAGVTVGVVSDGVLNLATSQAAGEPPEVTIVDPTTFGAGTGDEGTA